MAEHNVTLELWYDAAWHVAPPLVRDRISYTRGNKSFSNDTDPAQGTATLDNTSRLYAPRSVLSALYGKIGQNTPIRLSADSSVRMTAEVASWEPQRPVKGSGWTLIELAGILRRIGIGTDPIRSAVVRAAYDTADDGLVSFWAFEEGQYADAATNLVQGQELMIPSDPVAVTFGKFDDALVPAGLEALPALAGAAFSARVTATSTASWRVEWASCFEADSIPNDGTVVRQILWTTNGGIDFWWCDTDFDSTSLWGTSRAIAGLPFGDPFSATTLVDGRVHHYAIDVEQTDSTHMAYSMYLDGVLVNSGNNTTGALIGAPQVGPPVDVRLNPDGDTRIITVGAAGVWSPHPATPIDYQAVLGYAGELAAPRFQRFCDQEGITATIVDGGLDTVAMGPQTRDPLLQQFDLIAATDDASIFETRGSSGLTMRTGGSKLNQDVDLTVSYLGQVQPPLRPVVGDEGIRNDVTARNPDGSTARVTQPTGPRNTQSPLADPQGVGRYATSLDVNAADALTLAAEAGWRLGQGTYDGTWYASVTIDLDAAPGLILAVNAVDIGDLVRLRDLPAEDTISDFYGLIIAIAEALPAKRRLVTLYLIPADPYRVGVLADTSGDTAALVGHLETDTATLAADAAAGAATFTVTADPVWTTAADDFPQDVVVGAQRVTISAVSGASAPQTFTVSTTPGGYTLAYPAKAGAVISQYQPIIPTLVD